MRKGVKLLIKIFINYVGGLAQMVERTLSMREVQGSMPWSSNQI